MDSTPTSRSFSFGLQTRILFSYAIGGLAISLLLAIATLTFTRQQLVDDREASAAAIAVNNASRLSNQLTPESTIEDVPGIIDSLTRIEGAQTIVRLNDSWLPGTEIGYTDLPSSLVIQVGEGEPGQMRSSIEERPYLTIGIPLVAFEADYFEVVDLSDVDSTLDNLQIIIVGAATFTTILGALIGLWASRRTLRPLRRVGEAAAAIAGGNLDTRLEEQHDPDLDVLTESFNEMVRALEDRIQRDARFASDVSHELRSPLMTLTSSVAVLEARRNELSERSKTALDLLSIDLSRFSRLVEDLLEISRFDGGVASLENSSIKIHSLVSATLRTLRIDSSILVELTPISDLYVRGDKRRLGRALSNMLTNGIQHGGGITAVSISSKEDHVEIAIEDEGPGVAESERSEIFDRFSRGSSAGRRGDDTGSGLGLSMVHEDIRLHGGQVWVEDRLDEKSGARFIIQLPMMEKIGSE